MVCKLFTSPPPVQMEVERPARCGRRHVGVSRQPQGGWPQLALERRPGPCPRLDPARPCSTPLIEVDGAWVKLEYLNPAGSIKARMARYSIERDESEGLLHPGDTIVEASSGNTGNAMSMVAAVKGYKMLVVMPEGPSPEGPAISTAFGHEMLSVGNFHVNDALEMVRRLGDQPGHFAPLQFESEWNVEENRTWLGPEIIDPVSYTHLRAHET